MSDESATKPTIETVLERMAELRTDLTAQISELRESVETRLHKVENKIGALNDGLLDIRADMRVFDREKK